MADGSQTPAAQGVTITPEQYAQLQRSALLLQKLASGPTKREFERIVKVHVPDVETTDDVVEEAARPYREQLDQTNKRLEELLARQEERDRREEENRAIAELDSRFAALRDQGLTEKGEEAVRKLMIERNIADPAAAFALFERNNPRPTDTASAWEPDSWNISSNAVERDVDGLFKNPDRWADIEVGNVLAELRRPQPI